MTFRRRWGPESERPESYWQPFLGELSLTPAALGDITPWQMDGCRDWFDAKNG